MELKGRNATWLELAVAPLWRLGQTRVRIHSLSGGRECCVGITVDERWLCANDGRLTVFGCRDSATRFLELLRIDHLEEGPEASLPGSCSDPLGVQCLRLGARGVLQECDGGVSRSGRGGPERIMIRSKPQRATFERDFMR
ncbi:hypothetical protein [Zoogloea sp.]|uniref:hypothetical protein n=1 Tax=Zoogloea sp. TaxID=49181 RepID=UPI001415FA9A|nr:MAG: hypothetical protein F9K15_01330 [Zoogloea sp.]